MYSNGKYNFGSMLKKEAENFRLQAAGKSHEQKI
jgi:hypothetical protein